MFRTLVDDTIPLNEGCLKPIRLIVPEGSMLNPRYPAAVVAGDYMGEHWLASFALLALLAETQG